MNNKLIILISGKMGSGKTTLSNALQAHFSEIINTEQMKFAGIIYEIHDAVIEISKKYNMPLSSGKDRTLLQLLGTEWGRKTKGENVWVDAVMQKVSNSNAGCVILDDLRFMNELKAFSKMPYTISIRLNCPESIRKERAGSSWSATPHASELELDGLDNEFDFVFDTSATDAQTMVDKISVRAKMIGVDVISVDALLEDLFL